MSKAKSAVSTGSSWINKSIGYIVAALGSIGAIASLFMTVEYIETLKDPSFQPICNINPIISCGSVLDTSQGEVFFGIPNPLLGIAGYSALAALGIAILAGATFKRWLWLAIQAGTAMAAVFAMWLFYQGVYVIGSICPFCTVIWLTAVPLFWYTTLYNLKNNYIILPKKLTRFKSFVIKHHADILLVWFLLLVIIILNQFWYYWQTLL